MPARLKFLRGLDRLNATTAVLQRARLADPLGGTWEAADVQWWWRRPRATDDLPLPVWFDDVGPAAAIGLTAWDRTWQGDVFAIPGVVEVGELWSALLEAAAEHHVGVLELLLREDDEELRSLASASGFRATDECSGITWMSVGERPPVGVVPDGFVVVDRSQRADLPHPMIPRNGEHVEVRLRQCSLYDPTLDLSAEAADGAVAGYALVWLDDVTGVGMLEPMRVDEAYQRRGLVRALLTEGLDRLARNGATRLKVGFDGDAGRNLYLGAGFVEVAALRTALSGHERGRSATGTAP